MFISRSFLFQMNISICFSVIVFQFITFSFCHAQETWDSTRISDIDSIRSDNYTLLVTGRKGSSLDQYKGVKLFSEQVFGDQIYPTFASLITPEKPDVFYLTGFVLKASSSDIVATRAWDTHKVWNHYGEPIRDQVVSYSKLRERMSPDELIRAAMEYQEVKGHNEIMIYPLDGELERTRIVGVYLYRNENGENFEGLDYKGFEEFAKKHNLPIIEFRASRKAHFLDFKTPAFHHLNAPKLYKVRQLGLSCKSFLSSQ